MFLSQGSTCLVGFVASPILGESWLPWGAMTLEHWLVFGFYCLVVLLGGNMLQVAAIRTIGPATVSSLLALRLITAMCYGAVVLHEDMTNPLQLVGAAVVIVTISVYLWRLRAGARPATATTTEESGAVAMEAQTPTNDDENDAVATTKAEVAMVQSDTTVAPSAATRDMSAPRLETSHD